MRAIVLDELVISIDTVLKRGQGSAEFWITKRVGESYEFVGHSAVGIGQTTQDEIDEVAEKFYRTYLHPLFKDAPSSPHSASKPNHKKPYAKLLATTHILAHRQSAGFSRVMAQTKAEHHLAKLLGVGSPIQLLTELDSLPLSTVRRRVAGALVK